MFWWKRREASADNPGNENPAPEVSVTDTCGAIAGDGGTAVTGLSGPAPGPGASVHVAHTGPAIALGKGAIAITGVVGGDLIVPSLPVPPRQLEQRQQFVGRAAELDTLLELLAPRPRGGVGVVVGLPGAGKTALVTEAGYKALEQGWFNGGHLFLNLRGYDAMPLSAYDALGRLLRDLGVSLDETHGDEMTRARRLRSELADRPEPLLIVLDNARHASQVRPLLPGEGPHRVLVTSRNKMPQLDAKVLTLGVLSPEDSIDLMDRTLRDQDDRDTRFKNQPADATKPTPATEVVRLCGYLPLALRIAAALLASNPARPLAEFAEQLEDARLDQLNDDEKAVRAAFDLSYRQLTAQEALLFRRMSLNGSPDISLAAAAAVTGLSKQTVRALLDRLVAAHLVNQGNNRSRWTMHDLLWEYAALAMAEEPEQSRDEARDLLLDYYNQACAIAATSTEPSTQDSSSHTSGRPDTSGWLDAERVNLVAAVAAAAKHGRDGVALELAGHLSGHLREGHRWDDMLIIDEARLDIARRSHDQPGRADALCALGVSLHRLSRFPEGADRFQQALTIDQELGGNSRLREARDLVGLGRAQRGLGEFAIAEANLREAAKLRAAEQDNNGRHGALNELAMTLIAAGREADAWEIWKDMSI